MSTIKTFTMSFNRWSWHSFLSCMLRNCFFYNLTKLYYYHLFNSLIPATPYCLLTPMSIQHICTFLELADQRHSWSNLVHQPALPSIAYQFHCFSSHQCPRATVERIILLLSSLDWECVDSFSTWVARLAGKKSIHTAGVVPFHCYL